MPDSMSTGTLRADETPNTDTRTKGPTSEPTHPLALAPVSAPTFSVDGFVREFLHELNTNQGVTLSESSVNDQYLALSSTVKNYLMARWLETNRKTHDAKVKTIGYLSAEYLLGRQLNNALLATNLQDIATAGLAQCGLDLPTLR
ncbi:MAG TPA: glycogen phosphorylase, partial [Tessaracoccus flavescens]|nr:glycogen phosphorylase [Tessaracoccus flavescens]